MWILYSRSKSNTKIFSRLISLFTKTKEDKYEYVPSHMAIVFGQRFMIEAKGGGVRLNFMPTFLKENEVIKVFDYKRGYLLGLEDKKLILEACLRYHGLPYDFAGVMWFAFYITRKWITGMPVPNRNDWDNNNAFFCSELMQFVDSRNYDTSDPNSQMKQVSLNIEDYKVLFDRTNGDDWEGFWYSYKKHIEELSKR